MTVIARVRRTQRGLVLAIAGSAICWAAVAGCAVLAVAAPIVAGGAALATLGVLLWRGRSVWSTERVALWIEERAPALRYAVVTAVDPRYAPAIDPVAERLLATVDTSGFIRSVAFRSIAPALVALLGVAAIVGRAAPAHHASLRAGHGAEIENRLLRLHGTVAAPGYTKMAIQALRDPTVISGIVGSRVVLSGPGAPDGVQIAIEQTVPARNQNVPVDDSANARSAEPLAMSGAAAIAALRDGQPDNEQAETPDGGQPPPAPAPRSRGRRAVTPPSSLSSLAAPMPAPAVTRLAIVADHSARGGWTTTWTLSDSMPALLTLVDRQYRRSIVIDPRPDRPPTARLVLPARDTTVRAVGATLALSALLTDDIGLDSARFEYIKCSSGESDEDFVCTSGAIARRTFHDATTGDFTASVPLASFQLRPGDRFSVRAVAWDNNRVTGPGVGTSDTRTIRVARASEYERSTVPPVPPSADTATITLRMLLRAVERLAHDRPAMPRTQFEDSSVALGDAAAAVQSVIGSIIDEQTDGGEVAVDSLLALSRDSIVDAVTDLRIGEPGQSLPSLRITYDALKRYTTGARYYLRGVLAEPPVDIARVRLTGSDSGWTSPRPPRLVSDAERAQYWREYVSGVEALASAPDDAVETLTRLQVETLRTSPAVAAAIGDALTALRSRADATAPLSRARALLAGWAPTVDSLTPWSGAW
jgi:hypothetical protein